MDSDCDDNNNIICNTTMRTMMLKMNSNTNENEKILMMMI